MAEVVKKGYDFPEPRTRNKYPWSEWLDGRVWALKQGEDFTVNPTNFASSAKSWGERHDITVRTNIEDGTVFVQAVISEQ
jgi:hypothetical protein